MSLTVNEALGLIKAIRTRIKDLDNLREKVSVTETYFSSKDKEVKPEYDVKKVDQKITELTKMMFTLDNAIKTKNAVTVLDTDVDTDRIFDPLV